MKTWHWYFPWATALHLYNMTGRGGQLQQLHCYHPFSDSLDIYLTKNHYENYSPKMVPIAKIWGSGSWTNGRTGLLYKSPKFVIYHIITLVTMCDAYNRMTVNINEQAWICTIYINRCLNILLLNLSTNRVRRNDFDSNETSRVPRLWKDMNPDVSSDAPGTQHAESLALMIRISTYIHNLLHTYFSWRLSPAQVGDCRQQSPTVVCKVQQCWTFNSVVSSGWHFPSNQRDATAFNKVTTHTDLKNTCY